MIAENFAIDNFKVGHWIPRIIVQIVLMLSRGLGAICTIFRGKRFVKKRSVINSQLAACKLGGGWEFEQKNGERESM